MTASADGGPGLSGQLTFSNAGVNCDGVEINLERSYGVQVRQAYTDLICNFQFHDVGPGAYYLHVAVPGYVEVRQPVRIVDRGVISRVTLFMNRATDYQPPSSDFIVDASEILAQYPKAAVRHYQKSVEHREEGKSEQAILELEEAVELAPDFYAAHNDLGSLYGTLGQFDDAIDHLWRARDLNANNADPLITLSTLFLEKGELEDAERISTLAVETDPRSGLAFFNLGMALYRRSKMDRAEEAFLKALRLAPSILETRLALANVYGKLGRFDRILEQLDHYLEKAPDSPQRTQAERVREEILKLVSLKGQ
jgi:tetratricopeptide (TPR) repeat protein